MATNNSQIAIQLYTLRALGAEDFPGMLRQVADAGYKNVEFAGYGGMAAGDLKQTLDELGLRTVSAHVPFDRFDNEIDTVIGELNTLEAEYAVVPWLKPEARPTTRDAALALAEKLNQFAQSCKAGGLRFGYHNHDFELKKVDGDKTVLDLIAETTDPDLVTIQLDIYWAEYAGGDAVAMTRHFAGRLPMIHAKDLESKESGSDAVVGEGVIDFPAVIAAARESDTEWFIVEQDNPNPADPVSDVRRSLQNLEKLLG
jgi:sugar phosphate isomerase/epimerase